MATKSGFPDPAHRGKRAAWDYSKQAKLRRAVEGMRKYNYGITPEEYDAMFALQAGLCAVCGEPETARSKQGVVKRLSVDHNHTTDQVRALLCIKCNAALGMLDEDIAKITALAVYIAKFK